MAAFSGLLCVRDLIQWFIILMHGVIMKMACRYCGCHSIKNHSTETLRTSRQQLMLKVQKSFVKVASFLLKNFLHFLSYRSSWMSKILLREKEINLILQTGCRSFIVRSRQFLLWQQPFNPSHTSLLTVAHSICRTRVRTRFRSEVNSFKQSAFLSF